MSDQPPWRPPPPPPGPPPGPPGPPGPPWGPPGSWGPPPPPGPRPNRREDAVVPAVVAATCSVPFVLVVFWVSVGFSVPLAGAVVLGVVALSGVPLLFLRRWAFRGIGMGLLIGWAVMTILSAGICTGVNPVFYDS